MWLERTELVLGETRLRRLANARVAVIGLGGVGGAAAEALVRAGVGHMLFIDGDTVDDTNRNRQLLATTETVGMDKISAAEGRYRAINPDGDFTFKKEFYLPENSAWLYDWQPDYIIDAIDTVTGKLEIIKRADVAGVPVISSMGAGNKLDPTAFRVADIYQTKVCPLAKVMRRELKKAGIKSLKVVYSEEQPIRPIEDMAISCRQDCICPPGTARKCTVRRDIPGSTAFVPSVVGLIVAGEVIKDLAKK